MISRESVAAWLQAYVETWKTYDQKAIGELFSENASYIDNPYRKPVYGREAIIASWVDNPDSPGTYDGHYEPILIEGDRAVTHGRSLYFEPDGKTLKKEFDNIFVLRFDEQGRCAEYSEWYMERPKDNSH